MSLFRVRLPKGVWMKGHSQDTASLPVAISPIVLLSTELPGDAQIP